MPRKLSNRCSKSWSPSTTSAARGRIYGPLSQVSGGKPNGGSNGSQGNWRSKTMAWRAGSPRSFAREVSSKSLPDSSRSCKICSMIQPRSEVSAEWGSSRAGFSPL